MRNLTFFFFFFFMQIIGYGQCVPADVKCDNSSNSMSPETGQVDFLFDSFTKYNAGIDQYGSTILKLTVKNNPAQICRWKLSMIVSNNGWVNTDQWNALATYGAGVSGTNPTIDLLEIRVTNNCATPTPGVYNTWRRFAIPPGTGDVIDIINDPFPDPVTAAGPANCGGLQVNGAGTYLSTDYGEFSFTIDYRIRPGFNWIPGYYNLSVKFCLTE